MKMRAAEGLAGRLEESLPEFEVTAVPWADEREEWIVTVWDDGVVVVDIFGLRSGAYLLRRVGRGKVVGRGTVEEIPAMVRKAAGVKT